MVAQVVEQQTINRVRIRSPAKGDSIMVIQSTQDACTMEVCRFLKKGSKKQVLLTAESAMIMQPVNRLKADVDVV